MGGPIIKLSKVHLRQIVGSPRGAAAGAEATLRLTESQVFEAVSQLSMPDKRELSERLAAELERIEEDFGKAVEKIRKTYKNVAEDEIEKDVAGAVAEVRAKYRAESCPRH